MNDRPLVEISDLLGLGKLADSRAVTLLVQRLIDGIGFLGIRAVARRRANAQAEQMQTLRAQIQPGELVDAEIDERARLQIRNFGIREQANRESVAVYAPKALETLRVLELDNKTTASIDDTWLNFFWANASKVSSADAQEIWGMVLARQAAGMPFSLRALQVLQTMSHEEAVAVERLAYYLLTCKSPDGRKESWLMSKVFAGSRHPRNPGFIREATRSWPLSAEDARELMGPIGLVYEAGSERDVEVAMGGGVGVVDVCGLLFEIFAREEVSSVRLGTGQRLTSVGREIFALPATPSHELLLSWLSSTLSEAELSISPKRT